MAQPAAGCGPCDALLLIVNVDDPLAGGDAIGERHDPCSALDLAVGDESRDQAGVQGADVA